MIECMSSMVYKTCNHEVWKKTENPKILQCRISSRTSNLAFPAPSTDTGILTHLYSQGLICALGLRNSLLAHQVALHNLRRLPLEVASKPKSICMYCLHLPTQS